MTPACTLREAAAADAREIAALVNRAYRPTAGVRGWTHEARWVAGARTSAAQLLALLQPGSAVLVLCAEASIVACVHVAVERGVAAIGMLATEPALQSQGLGRQMLVGAEAYAAGRLGALTARMEVLAARPELLAFYERLGYERVGELRDYQRDAGVGEPLAAGLRVQTLQKAIGDLPG